MFPWEIKYSLNLSVLAYFGYSYLYTFVIYLYHNLQNSRISRGLEGRGGNTGDGGNEKEGEREWGRDVFLTPEATNVKKGTKENATVAWTAHLVVSFCLFFFFFRICLHFPLCVSRNHRKSMQTRKEKKIKPFSHLETFQGYLDVKKIKKKEKKKIE